MVNVDFKIVLFIAFLFYGSRAIAATWLIGGEVVGGGGNNDPKLSISHAYIHESGGRKYFPAIVFVIHPMAWWYKCDEGDYRFLGNSLSFRSGDISSRISKNDIYKCLLSSYSVDFGQLEVNGLRLDVDGIFGQGEINGDFFNVLFYFVQKVKEQEEKKGSGFKLNVEPFVLASMKKTMGPDVIGIVDDDITGLENCLQAIDSQKHLSVSKEKNNLKLFSFIMVCRVHKIWAMVSHISERFYFLDNDEMKSVCEGLHNLKDKKYPSAPNGFVKPNKLLWKTHSEKQEMDTRENIDTTSISDDRDMVSRDDHTSETVTPKKSTPEYYSSIDDVD